MHEHTLTYPSLNDQLIQRTEEATGLSVLVETAGVEDRSETVEDQIGYSVPPKQLRPSRSNLVVANIGRPLWWTYFGWIRELLEEKLAGLPDQDRTRLGRDVYTILHFPLVSGIVALAIGFEGAFHPEDYTATQITSAVGVGLTLFLIATAAAVWRAVRCVLWNRLAVLGVTLSVLTFRPSLAPLHTLGIACIGVSIIVAIEQVTVRRHLASA